jgi:hypothetical protein
MVGGSYLIKLRAGDNAQTIGRYDPLMRATWITVMPGSGFIKT